MGPKPQSQPQAAEPVKEYPTIGVKLQAEYLASRPYEVLKDTKGLSGMTTTEKAAYAIYKFLDTGVWRDWNPAQQKEFWKAVETQKIPIPLTEPVDLGKDSRGRDIASYTPEEYTNYEKKQGQLRRLRTESRSYRERVLISQTVDDEDPEENEFKEDIEVERNRRKLIGHLQGKKMGRYEADPVWDDVVPIPQDDGEGALAAIAYTDEYSEAMGYLRAAMAAQEHSERVLGLTEHIISMNAAHYTVWLYRASTLFALSSPINDELEWVNEVALENQKNYQIWHHRQLLIDHLYPTISSSESEINALGKSEVTFLTKMFAEDSKNYHVWSYRQYLVRKLNLFNSDEIKSIEILLRQDVRNNSAWCHRFFIVFFDPSYSTPGSKATEHDPKIPDEIVDREIEFAKAATFEAPQNQSPWNYLRGVLRKGGRKLVTLEGFAEEFVKIPNEGEEDVKSSHALDFLADVWSDEGKMDKANKALTLLGDKYDRIRKNYWEWRKALLKEV